MVEKFDEAKELKDEEFDQVHNKLDSIRRHINDEHDEMVEVTTSIDQRLSNSLTKVTEDATERIEKLYADMMAQIHLMQKSQTTRAAQIKADCMVLIEESRTEMGLNNPGLSKKTNLFTLHKLNEMILVYLMTHSLLAP